MGCLLLPMVQLPGADPRPLKQMVRGEVPMGRNAGRCSSRKQVDRGKDPCQGGGERESQPGVGLGFCMLTSSQATRGGAGGVDKRRQGSVRLDLGGASDSCGQVPSLAGGGRSPSRAPFHRPTDTLAGCVTLFKPRIHSGPHSCTCETGSEFPPASPLGCWEDSKTSGTGAASSTCNIGASGNRR